MVRQDTLVTFARNVIETATLLSRLSTQSFTMAGLKLNLRSNNTSYNAFCNKQFVCSGQGHVADEYDIYVCSPQDSSMSIPPKWAEPVHDSYTMERALEGTPYSAAFAFDENIWYVIDNERRVGVQWLSHEDSFPPWESSAPLRIFLHWIYSNIGSRQLIHAGTLGKNNRGVLIAGNGGTGKSGTVVAGILHGLQSVGDDYVLVHSNSDGISVHPLFATLKQDKAGVERLNLSKTILANQDANWQDKYEFDCSDLGAGDFVSELDIDAVIVPQVTGDLKTTITPVSKAAAMIALAPSGTFQLPDKRVQTLKFASDIVRRSGCFQLNLGIDPVEIVGVISKFLESLDG